MKTTPEGRAAAKARLAQLINERSTADHMFRVSLCNLLKAVTVSDTIREHQMLNLARLVGIYAADPEFCREDITHSFPSCVAAAVVEAYDAAGARQEAEAAVTRAA